MRTNTLNPRTLDRTKVLTLIAQAEAWYLAGSNLGACVLILDFVDGIACGGVPVSDRDARVAAQAWIDNQTILVQSILG